MEAGKRMIIRYLVKVLCRQFDICRLATTTNNIKDKPVGKSFILTRTQNHFNTRNMNFITHSKHAKQNLATAVVTDKHKGRSYTVHTNDGKSYMRNHKHLLKSNECIPTPYIELHILEEIMSLPQQKQLETPEFSSSAKTAHKCVNQYKLVYITNYGRHMTLRITESM